jgi:acetolactate synthase small subunit
VHQTHRLELTVTAEPTVLDRIVGLCRARQCPIVSLHFQAPGRHRPGRLTVGFTADERRARLVTERLASLVDVIDVRSAGTASTGDVAVERGPGSGRVRRRRPRGDGRLQRVDAHAARQ